MTAPLTKEQLAPLMATNVTYRGPAVEQAAPQTGFNFFNMLGNVVRYIVELPRRQAVMNELSRLTDRELTDIGVTRAEIPDIFARAR